MTLAVDKGNSVTKFDDLRIVERQTDIMNPDKQTVIKQDFEDTQAVGLYPFVKGSAGGVEDPRIHLSERNEPYTIWLEWKPCFRCIRRQLVLESP